MKKIFAVTLSFLAFHGTAQQLSPQTEIYLKKIAAKEPPLADYVYRQDSSGKWWLPAMIMTDGSLSATALQQKGIQVHTQAGNIWTVSFPAATFSTLVRNLSGVTYIEVDAALSPAMDAARAATRTDSVHQGIGLPFRFSGAGVVTGILDVGFEYNHPAFYDTTGTIYRVRRIWEQKALSGTPPAGYAYGREITDTALMKTAGSDKADNTHGMHVAGIAVGSGRGAGDTTNRRYRGIAYASDVVLVGITPAASAWTSTSMSDIIDGMNYVYRYAASVGKPAVVNLSWGTPVGPHDGRSLFSQACDNLTGAGKLFALSAGNNGQNAIHTQAVFTATDTLTRTAFIFPQTPAGRRSWIDIWGIQNQNLRIQLSLLDSTTNAITDSTGWISLATVAQSVALRGVDGDTLSGYVSAQVAAFNNKPRILLDLESKTKGRLLISVKGTPGMTHFWAGFVHQSTGYYGSFNTGGFSNGIAGNNSFSISDMSTTASAMAVGAYNTKTIYTDVDGNIQNYASYGYTQGRLAPFSSRGPATEGRMKPDIAAPGMMVVAPVSGFDTSYAAGGNKRSATVTEWTSPSGTNYRYGALMGTSMASPVTAGILALLLEADTSLTPARAKEIIQETALRDNFTGTIPATGSPNWGAGKINAYGALQRALATLGISEQISNPNQMALLLYPNPGSGQPTLEFESSVAGKATVRMTDALGRTVYLNQFPLQNGANKMDLRLNAATPGIYFMELVTPSGRAGLKYFKK